MKRFLWTTVSLLAILLFAATLFAQSIPRNGACFYRDTAYRGTFFCANAGDSLENLPSGFNDSIRSVRIFGGAQVVAYSDNRFSGASINISSDVPDLRMLQLSTDRNKNWSGRISSVQLGGGFGRDRGPGGDRGYPNMPQSNMPQWGNGNLGSGSGACFFDQPNFRGRSFCVTQGQALNNLPPGFNDRIQSIQVRGPVEVQIYNDNNFGGAAARTRRDVPNLRSWSIPDDPNKNWGGRISSIRVDMPGSGRWDNNGGYRDWDRDRNNNRGGNGNLVRCSSRPGEFRKFCDTNGSVRDADLTNSSGVCRKNDTWGVAAGRLWVSNGCSGEFQVRR